MPSQSATTILVVYQDSGPRNIFLGFGTLNKGSKKWVAKSRAQKAGSLLFKKRRGKAGLDFFQGHLKSLRKELGP